MKKSTVALFATLVFLLVAALAWFQTHQHQLMSDMSVAHGAMSEDSKQKFFKQGIDCQETYELQGYEGPETVFRMFSLNQHDFYNLNPGQSMDFKAGQVICVRGIWGLTNRSRPMAWFWPAVAVAAAAVGFLGNSLLNQYKAAAQPGQQGGSQAGAAAV